MKITDIRINGIREPMGFGLPQLFLSWKVRESRSRNAAATSVTVAGDPAFREVLYEQTGTSLQSFSLEIPMEPAARTRYYCRIRVERDAGDSAMADSFFETGKMGEPWAGKWIGTREEDRFHPVFFRNFQVPPETVSARLYVSGLGLYEAYVNGEKVKV